MHKMHFHLEFVEEHKLVLSVAVLIMSFSLLLQLVFFSLLSNQDSFQASDCEYAVEGVDLPVEDISEYVASIEKIVGEIKTVSVSSTIEVDAFEEESPYISVILIDEMKPIKSDVKSNEVCLIASDFTYDNLKMYADDGIDSKIWQASDHICLQYGNLVLCFYRYDYDFDYILLYDKECFCDRETFAKTFERAQSICFSTPKECSEENLMKLAKLAQMRGGTVRYNNHENANNEVRRFHYFFILVMAFLVFFSLKVIWYLVELRNPEIETMIMLGMMPGETMLISFATFAAGLFPATLLGVVEYSVVRVMVDRYSLIMQVSIIKVIQQIGLYIIIASLVFLAYSVKNLIYLRRRKYV